MATISSERKRGEEGISRVKGKGEVEKMGMKEKVRVFLSVKLNFVSIARAPLLKTTFSH